MVTRTTDRTTALTQTIGETAGLVWHILDEQGQLRLTTLQRRMEVSPALLYLALDWLAREDKVEITADGRSYRVRLS